MFRASIYKALLLIALIGFAPFFIPIIWKISVAVAEGAKNLEPTVYVPLVVTLVTASLGLAVTLYTQAKTKRQATDAAFRERKI